MRIKSFRADDVRQALALVKNEMGDEAVVLDTRTVRESKFLGLASKDQVEVMAAVDERPAPVAAAPPNDAMEQLRALQDEVRQIKSIVRANEPENDMPAVKLLNECGVPPELLKVSDERLAEVQDKTGLVELLADVMSKYTASRSSGASVVALVGPTGVGKTTTLAKLAARYALHEGKRVALITCDTFRIGGIEQIKVYARILNVPLEVVSSPEDMAAAVEKHSDADVIIIDTIGRSQKNALHLRELKALLAPAKPTEVYLVVSASSSQSVQMDVVNNFSVLSPNRLVISKVDESDILGCIVSLPVATGLPISCITNGQNVPDDLQMGESRMLANLVVGVAQ